MTNNIANFIQHCDLRGLSSATIKAYSRNLKLFSQFCEKNSCLGLDQLLHSLIIDFLKDHKTSQKISIIYTLKSFGKFLANEGNINPFSLLEAPKKKKTLPSCLTEEEVERLINIASVPKHKAIVEILYGAGLRVSELMNLKNKDINLNTRTIKVLGKGNKERLALIGTCAIKAIKQYKSLDNSEESFLGFATTGNVRKILSKYGQSIGIKITPHMLRHSAATHMLNRGANILLIKEFLGHESISTTQIYTHLDLRKLREDHAKLENVRKAGKTLINIDPPIKQTHPREENIAKLEKINKKKIKRKSSLPPLSTFQTSEILGLSCTTIIKHIKLGQINGCGGEGLFYQINAEHIQELLDFPPKWLQKCWSGARERQTKKNTTSN